MIETKDAHKLCVGLIVDGNRRWAVARGRAPYEGHAAGRATFREFVRWSCEAEIGTVIAYTFSSENWQRPKAEVDALMALVLRALGEDLHELADEGCRVRIVGERSRFSEKMQALFQEAEERTKGNTRLTVVLALSYGGRDEILGATRALLRAKVEPDALTPELFAKHLSTHGLPDPDLIIRTSGEQRLSNFLPWQSVYSELFFTPTLWPDFTKEEFFGIVSQFQERTRRFGR